MKRESDTNGDAVLLAVRPIAEGEEITISYVVRDSLGQRRFLSHTCISAIG